MLHFFLVTYQTPELKFLNWIRSHRNKELVTTDTSLPSSSPKSHHNPFNVVRKIPQVNGSIINNEHAEHQV